MLARAVQLGTSRASHPQGPRGSQLQAHNLPSESGRWFWTSQQQGGDRQPRPREGKVLGLDLFVIPRMRLFPWVWFANQLQLRLTNPESSLAPECQS